MLGVLALFIEESVRMLSQFARQTFFVGQYVSKVWPIGIALLGLGALPWGRGCVDNNHDKDRRLKLSSTGC